MVITDIEQIDRMAEEVLGAGKGVVSLDIKDYALIKRWSASLTAYKIEIPEIGEEHFAVLEEVMKEVCAGNECRIIMHLCCPKTMTITVRQMELLIGFVNRTVQDVVEFVWGISEHESDYDGITVLFIVGSKK